MQSYRIITDHRQPSHRVFLLALFFFRIFSTRFLCMTLTNQA
jgi:hypothetical protein